MNKESKLNLNASVYAISHCDCNKTYNGLEVHKMLCDAYIAGNNDTLNDKDEKIRKALINVFATHKDYEMFFGASVEDIRTWLEKQGKETSWKPSKEEMDVLYGLAYITNQYDEHKEEVIIHLYQDLKREFFNGSSYENMFSTNTSTEDDVRRRSTIQVLEYARSLDAYNQYGKADIDKNIAWLEKQGEQKASYTTIAETGNGGINALVTRELPTDGCDDEQKPAEKIEPKFQHGQWIVWQNKCYKVNYNGCGYELVDQNGLSTSLEYGTVEESAHLWDITKDAKEGDVLACENGWTCIFKCLNDNLFSSHCFMDHEGWFCKDGGQGHTLDNRICGEIYPATKEQRDTLFAKMKEAGYEWNAEKKELKKIEQKSAWSEEDEKKVNNLYVLLDQMVSFNMLSDKDATEFKDWLKSLRPHKTWKPSEEQIEILDTVLTNESMDDNIARILRELREQLKKLKER